MKKLRDVPLGYRIAVLVFGGISVFLFSVVFTLMQQEYRVAASPARPAWVMPALIALVAAATAFFAVVAWGAKYLADAVLYLCSEGLIWGSFFLILWGGSYSIYIGAAAGVAVLLCWVLVFVLIKRRALKLDIKALDDPNDNPRANRLIGKSRELGSYDYLD